jgi:hypothetical protein
LTFDIQLAPRMNQSRTVSGSPTSRGNGGFRHLTFRRAG